MLLYSTITASFGSSSQAVYTRKVFRKPKESLLSSHLKMATSVEVATTHPPPMEISGDAHGSAAVVPTTAAPGVIHPLPPGASAANTRVRSNSRTPDLGGFPILAEHALAAPYRS